MEKTKKHSKARRIVRIILALVAALLIGLVVVVLHMAKSLGSSPVTDYDTRIEIWGTVAGNSDRSKLDDMNIDENKHLFTSMIAFTAAIVGDEYEDDERIIDTFTYQYEIKGGYEKETYEDAPYLIPYVVSGSDIAVIILPGGGYGYKTMDGNDSEGKDIALALNEAGISAFVLHYRSNPYEFPIPQLDLQRAVRYLRSNADEFGFLPENIGLIGYSAGGYQIGSYINMIMGNNYFPDAYIPDETDEVDDSIFAGGMIYPALTYTTNVPMLFSSFDADTVRDAAQREVLLNQMDLPLHFTSTDVPQFIAYGTKDMMVGMDGVERYIAAAESAGCALTVVVANGQNHGFAQKYYMNDFLEWLKELDNIKE